MGGCSEDRPDTPGRCSSSHGGTGIVWVRNADPRRAGTGAGVARRALPPALRDVVGAGEDRGLRAGLPAQRDPYHHGNGPADIYKEIVPMKKEDVDLANAFVWIPDSKTASGVAEAPLTEFAVEAFRKQIAISGPGLTCFPTQRTRPAIRPASRRSGRRRFGRRESLTSGFTISDRHMRLA
jgi:hypothetical protein